MNDRISVIRDMRKGWYFNYQPFFINYKVIPIDKSILTVIWGSYISKRYRAEVAKQHHRVIIPVLKNFDCSIFKAF